MTPFRHGSICLRPLTIVIHAAYLAVGHAHVHSLQQELSSSLLQSCQELALQLE